MGPGFAAGIIITATAGAGAKLVLESLNEHYVAGGIAGAINQIPSRLADYEDYFLEKYNLNEMEDERR
jgi:hypothetical protein